MKRKCNAYVLPPSTAKGVDAQHPFRIEHGPHYCSGLRQHHVDNIPMIPTYNWRSKWCPRSPPIYNQRDVRKPILHHLPVPPLQPTQCLQWLPGAGSANMARSYFSSWYNTLVCCLARPVPQSLPECCLLLRSLVMIHALGTHDKTGASSIGVAICTTSFSSQGGCLSIITQSLL